MDKGKDTQLLFHSTSYPKKGKSANSEMPQSKCSIKYPDFYDVIQRCMEEINLALEQVYNQVHQLL